MLASDTVTSILQKGATAEDLGWGLSWKGPIGSCWVTERTLEGQVVGGPRMFSKNEVEKSESKLQADMRMPRKARVCPRKAP